MNSAQIDPKLSRMAAGRYAKTFYKTIDHTLTTVHIVSCHTVTEDSARLPWRTLGLVFCPFFFAICRYSSQLIIYELASFKERSQSIAAHYFCAYITGVTFLISFFLSFFLYFLLDPSPSSSKPGMTFPFGI